MCGVKWKVCCGVLVFLSEVRKCETKKREAKRCKRLTVQRRTQAGLSNPREHFMKNKNWGLREGGRDGWRDGGREIREIMCKLWLRLVFDHELYYLYEGGGGNALCKASMAERRKRHISRRSFVLESCRALFSSDVPSGTVLTCVYILRSPKKKSHQDPPEWRWT